MGEIFRKGIIVVKRKRPILSNRPFSKCLAERTGLEPATPCVTGRYSNQLNYRSTDVPRRERGAYYGAACAASTLFLWNYLNCSLFHRKCVFACFLITYTSLASIGRHKQLPPFFCTRSRRDSCAIRSCSLARTTRRPEDGRVMR